MHEQLSVMANGHHDLSCTKRAGRQQSHSAVNDIIHRALHSAGVQAIREPVGFGGQSDFRPYRDLDRDLSLDRDLAAMEQSQVSNVRFLSVQIP